MFSILNCFRWQTKPKMFIHGELYYEVSLGCYVCSYWHNFLCSNLKKCTLSNLVSAPTLSQELGDLVALCALVSYCLWALLDSNPRSIFASAFGVGAGSCCPNPLWHWTMDWKVWGWVLGGSICCVLHLGQVTLQGYVWWYRNMYHNMLPCEGLVSHLGEEAILLVTSCPQSEDKFWWDGPSRF